MPQKKAPEQETPVKQVERALWPLAAFALTIGFIAGFLAAWDQIADLFSQRPVLVGSLVAIAAVLLAWAALVRFSTRLSRRSLWAARLLLLLAIFVAYYAFIVRPNQCLIWDNCPPADWVPSEAIAALVFSPAHAAEPDIQVLGLTVDQSRSSFIMRRDKQSIHGGDEDQTRITLEFDRRMPSVFAAASCRGVRGEAPIDDALPVWQTILRTRGRPDLARSLQDYGGYRRLIRSSGRNAFRQARPTTAELQQLRASNPYHFSLMQRWMVECVGVSDPVLIWTLQNNSRRPLILSSVEYAVLDIGAVKGANDVALVPIDVQPHELAYKKGLQTRALAPQIRIAPSETITLRIAYRLEDNSPGRSWLVRPRFKTLQGPVAVAPEIKIFAAK